MATESPCSHLTIGIQVCTNMLTSILCSYFLQLIYASHPSQKHHPQSRWGLGPATHEDTSQTLPFCLPGLLSTVPLGPSKPCHMLSLFIAAIVPTIYLNPDHRVHDPYKPYCADWTWGVSPFLLSLPFGFHRIMVCLTYFPYFSVNSVLHDWF